MDKCATPGCCCYIDYVAFLEAGEVKGAIGFVQHTRKQYCNTSLPLFEECREVIGLG